MFKFLNLTNENADFPRLVRGIQRSRCAHGLRGQAAECRLVGSGVEANKKGFTLFELLIVISILSVLACFTSLPSLYQKNKVTVIKNEIKSAIQYAKMQAMLRGETLLLTHLPDMIDWSDGMILMVDNAKHQYRSNDPILYQWHWASPGLRVLWHGFQSPNYLLCSAEMERRAMNGYFLIQIGLKEEIRLTVNRLGRVT